MTVRARSYRFVIEPPDKTIDMHMHSLIDTESKGPSTKATSSSGISNPGQRVNIAVGSSASSSGEAINSGPHVDRSTSLVDWNDHRRERAFRGGVSGKTVWYKSSGPTMLHAPPATLRADPADLFLYTNQSEGDLQVWLLNEDDVWHAIEEGHIHPQDTSRRLHLQPGGDPSWVTRATYNGYVYQRKKAGAVPSVHKSAANTT